METKLEDRIPILAVGHLNGESIDTFLQEHQIMYDFLKISYNPGELDKETYRGIVAFGKKYHLQISDITENLNRLHVFEEQRKYIEN